MCAIFFVGNNVVGGKSFKFFFIVIIYPLPTTKQILSVFESFETKLLKFTEKFCNLKKCLFFCWSVVSFLK